ncbi:DNA-binding transcriptional LysR family regulator [Kineococcus xinjiangensis]|uniref:DNA-binding transcriptional LysR family regulator n=1 Tax=Kineococcus xinjiangensis TaxID=512762 RepID=A0A2S6IE45_9ACTN|nr:LysR family transcriptional regulator [Kineococcus xinjiangensis]PPK92494.1 DNA-binding transcriptional LysR family regulator [Kineococcus xinjiangensis]
MSIDSENFTIDLRRLRLLREVERRGTVAATAAALHLTPSAVSQQLAGLARDLDVPLLERHGRGVRLTGQARVLLGHADTVAAQLERARADLAAFGEGLVGEVRVGSLASAIAAVVGPALRNLRSERPGLRILVREREPVSAIDGLDTGDLDVAVSVDHRGAPARDDARYDRVDLLTDVLDALLPADHPLAAQPELDLADLAREEWVAAASDDACAQIIIGACATAGFSPDVRHHTQEYDSLAALVAAGAGVALVPRLAHPLRPPGLVVVPLTGTPPARSIYAATRAGRRTDAPTAAVVEELRRVACARPDASCTPPTGMATSR